MAASEHKALTVVNLPFIGEDGKGKRFEPGMMIPFEDFEASVEAAQSANPDADTPSAEEQVASLTEWGSISDDPDAELHADHRPVDPNVRTLAQIVSDAQRIVDELEAGGQDVPAKLRELAEISERQINTVDHGGGE